MRHTISFLKSLVREGSLERKARMENSKEVLGKIADRVLAYRPKPKTKAAKRRKRRDQYAKRRRSESSI